MRVLVTGGAGFIGSHLVDRLVGEDHDVRVLDSFVTGRRENLVHLKGQVEVIEGDIRSHGSVARAVRDCEVVLHHAALPSVPRSIEDPVTSNEVNVGGTLNVLLAARDAGARRVIYASSSSVYGATPGLPKREDMPVAPLSPYAVGKHAGEAYCRAFSEVYGLETLALRYFNVFGPRQDPTSEYAAVIPRFLEAAVSGGPLVVHGDGEQSRDFTYIDNVVQINLCAMAARDAAGAVFNAAYGGRITLNAVVEHLSAMFGRPLDVERTPPRPGDVRHSMADIERAEQCLGYRPVVGFAEGLSRTARAYGVPIADAAIA